MKKTLMALAASLLLATATLAQTTSAPAAVTLTASQRKATEELLAAMQAEQNMASGIDQMLKMQLAQNPQLSAVEPEMRAFFAKYMSWPSLKEDMIQLYVREFTEKEMRSMTTFYRSPAGQKFIVKQPELVRAGAELGQRRVQEHLPELRATLEAKMKQGEDK